ncbi:hypothetical protein L580_1367 [Serratia fonticola AU-P3(3)]|nr:hypothetical protein L580_1367 [Serratia fonticola AU-P3(3)]ERK10084.1 hypothetical protein L581_4482 [Serratia fonticola AU-AP2C]
MVGSVKKRLILTGCRLYAKFHAVPVRLKSTSGCGQRAQPEIILARYCAQNHADTALFSTIF